MTTRETTSVTSDAFSVETPFPAALGIASEVWTALGGTDDALTRLTFRGDGDLASPFPVMDLAAASFGVAGLAVSELLNVAGHAPATVDVDRRAATSWFDFPIAPSRFLDTASPHGVHSRWMVEFPTADERWIRVQATFPSLRRRLLDALDVPDGDMTKVADALRRLPSDEAEAMLTEAGAAAAVARTLPEWQAHPQGRAVSSEPLADIRDIGESLSAWRPYPGRPLLGLRVLDCTRIVAAPMATRFLAALGAEVLRVDAPDGDEVAMGPTDIVLGKRWTTLNLRTSEGHARFRELLATTDVFVHSYRPGALDGLGFTDEERARLNPGLVDIQLNAFGWTGPWRDRRGFDTLVQYASGIADRVASWANDNPAERLPLNALGHRVDGSRPRHLPVEALDFGTGYQLAAAALMGLARRVRTGRGSHTRMSLARTSHLLSSTPFHPTSTQFTLPWEPPRENTVRGMANRPSLRLEQPLTITGNPLYWDRPAEAAGASAPVWAVRRKDER